MPKLGCRAKERERDVLATRSTEPTLSKLIKTVFCYIACRESELDYSILWGGLKYCKNSLTICHVS
jgi:hypothetical protein